MTKQAAIHVLQSFPGITVLEQGTKTFIYQNNVYGHTCYSAGELSQFAQFAQWNWKR